MFELSFALVRSAVLDVFMCFLRTVHLVAFAFVLIPCLFLLVCLLVLVRTHSFSVVMSIHNLMILLLSLYSCLASVCLCVYALFYSPSSLSLLRSPLRAVLYGVRTDS